MQEPGYVATAFWFSHIFQWRVDMRTGVRIIVSKFLLREEVAAIYGESRRLKDAVCNKGK
jgi:hypothetical protein